MNPACRSFLLHGETHQTIFIIIPSGVPNFAFLFVIHILDFKMDFILTGILVTFWLAKFKMQLIRRSYLLVKTCQVIFICVSWGHPKVPFLFANVIIAFPPFSIEFEIRPMFWNYLFMKTFQTIFGFIARVNPNFIFWSHPFTWYILKVEFFFIFVFIRLIYVEICSMIWYDLLVKVVNFFFTFWLRANPSRSLGFLRPVFIFNVEAIIFFFLVLSVFIKMQVGLVWMLTTW